MGSNNPYDDSSNIFNKVMGGAMAAGAGYAGYKAVTDAEGFKNSMTRVVNAIAPVASQSNSSIKKDQISSTRDKMLAMERHSSERTDILTRNRDRITNDLISSTTWKKVGINHTELSESISSLGSKFRFNDLSQVTDAAGQSIGGKFTEALNKLGLEVQGTPTFKGTTGVFKVMENGRVREIEIPFAAHDVKTSAWIAKNGDAEYVAHLRADPSVHESGKGLKLHVRTHNESLLEMLQDPERIANQARSDRGFIRDFEQLSSGKIKDINKIKQIVNATSTSAILSNMSMSRLVQRSLQTDWLTDKNWVVATSDSQKAFQSGYVKIDQAGLRKLNSQLPGASSNVISAFAANQDPDKMLQYSGETSKAIFGFPQDLLDDPSRLTFSYGGTTITKSNVHTIDNEIIRRQYSDAFNGGLAFTLGQAQTSEYTMAIRNGSTARQVEREKSEKGLLYLNEKVGTKSINGVKASSLDNFRFTPTVMNRDIADGTNLAGYEKSVRDIFKGPKKGVVNLFGMLNPMGAEEYVSIEESIYKDMKAFQPVQWSVAKLADKGLDDKSAIEIEVWENNQKTELKNKRLTEIFEDKVLRDRLLKSDKMSIKIGKNNILGLTETGGEIWNNESANTVIGRGGQNLLKRSADLHINKNDYERMMADNADFQMMADGSLQARDANAPIKFYGQIEGKMTKAAVLNQRARGVVYGHIEDEAKQVARAAGIKAGLEWMPHIDIYKKILPQFNGKNTVMQKGSPEMLQFLQESIMGHLMAFNEDHVVLKDDMAARFNKYLGKVPKTTPINLTAEVVKGMSWNQNIKDEAAFGEQLYDTAALLGAMKEHTYNGSGQLIIDKKFNKEEGAKGLASAWDRATSDTAKDLFNTAHSGGTVDPRLARGHAWNIVSGIMPQEIMAMTQGTGFNTMNIGFRDLHHFLDKNGILEEFAYQNTSNSTKITAEMRLMNMSLGGDEQFGKALKAYEQRIGAKIQTYTPEELGPMLGEFGGSNFLSDIKHPNVFKNTFLNKDVNTYGFNVNLGDRTQFIGSADLYGKSYFLPKTGKVTLDDFAMDSAGFLNKLFMKGSVDKDELAMFHRNMISEMTSAKSGILEAAGMSVDYAMYAKHTVDKKFLHSDYMKYQGEFGEEVSNLLGNASKISDIDYRKMIQKQLEDNITIAKDKGVSLSAQLEVGFGQENFFTKYQAHIDKANSVEDARGIAEAITEDQARIAKQIQKEAAMFHNSGKAASREQYDSIRKLMTEDVATGLWVRHPAIYGSSYTAGALLVDKNMLEKQMAPGKVAIKNLFGDFDGDASMLKGVFSKLGRQQTQQLIDQTQRHTARIIDTFKQGGGLQFFQRAEDKQTAMLGKELSETMAHTLIHDAPLDSALAAYYTKSLTGALNIKARGIKGYMDDIISNKGLSDTELSKVHAYFSTIPSLFTEQKAISSKQAERILGGKAGMENVTDLIGSITSKNMLDSIKEMNGEVHPLITMALAGGGHKTQFAEDDVKLIKNIADLNLNIRELGDNELKQVYGFLNPGADPTDKIARYRKWTETNVPFLSTPEGKKLGLTEGTGFIDLAGRAMRSDKGFASESLEAVIDIVQKARSSSSKETMEEAMSKIVQYGNHFFEQVGDIFTQPEFSRSSPKSMFSGRSIQGWAEVKKFGRWLTEEGKAGGRIGGLSAAVLGGFTALNLLSGDGTPQNPNDLPSVNNPSFAAPRSNAMSARRTMSADSNYNSNMSLLTDNSTPHSMLTGAVQNMFGVASVSVSDGTNPYLSDMHSYSNN